MPKVKELLKQHDLSSPTMDKITRWSSTFSMIESVLECRNLIDILGESEKRLLVLAYEWTSIEKLYECMKICNEMTLSLQKQQSALPIHTTII